MHAEPAWAVVELHEQANRRRPVALAELVQGVGFESRSIIVATRGPVKQASRSTEISNMADVIGSRDVA
jgi:hypothetical protein